MASAAGIFGVLTIAAVVASAAYLLRQLGAAELARWLVVVTLIGFAAALIAAALG